MHNRVVGFEEENIAAVRDRRNIDLPASVLPVNGETAGHLADVAALAADDRQTERGGGGRRPWRRGASVGQAVLEGGFPACVRRP